LAKELAMTNTTSPFKTSHPTGAELLNMYLSSPPAVREATFMTTAQAAEFTDVSMRTIQFWIESGAVRAVVVGRKYRILIQSLRDHIEGQVSKRDG
jgi:excisionase family DNA binding protein